MPRSRKIRIVISALTLVLLLAGIGLLEGCGKKTKTENGSNGKVNGEGPQAWTEASVKPSDGPWSGTLQVTLGDWKRFQKIVDSYKGKVVVAGFFATWDEKNLFQIRHMAKLQSQFPEKVVCVLVSLGEEEPEAMRSKLEQLVKQWIGTELPGDAQMRLFLSTETDEEFYQDANSIDALPTVFVYDKAGKRKKIFLGGEKGIDYGLHVLPVVEDMLK